MIENTNSKVSYTANGTQRTWGITFPYEDTDTIELFIWSGSELNQIDDEDFTLNTTTNTITYPISDEDPAVTSGYIVVIMRETPQTQLESSEQVYFKSPDIERMVDKLTKISQELQEQLGRTIMFNPGEAGELDAGKYIRHLKSLVIEATTQATTATTQAGIATTKAGEAASSASAASTSATKASKWAEGNDSEVQALGGTHSAKNWAGVAQTYAESPAVQTVANNISNVNTVADNINNVNTVAGVAANVTTVAGNTTNINTVATNVSSVAAVAENISNVNAVAANETNINAVNSNKTNINAVAGNATNINAVNANKTNINAVNANKTNIDAVAGNATNINTVATNISDVNNVADDITKVSAVADDLTAINAVNSNKTNIDTVATNISDVTSVATAIADVSAVADDLTNIDNVADDLTNIDAVAASLSDIQDKQNKVLTNSVILGGETKTTVEDAIEAISEEWAKPTDWIDIRSAALPNSVYFLVGHSADYQTYPTFEFYVEAGSTYDVYIDGVKKLSAVASGTRSTLTWASLALTTGYDTTYPSALRTHIVRITPTDSTKNITRIGDNTASNTARAGLLWVHFTLTNAPQIRYLGQNASILEAVTCDGGTMLVTNAYSAFNNAEALKELPIIDGNNASVSLYNLFNGASSLKQITLQNATATSGTSTFKGTAIKKITCKNAKIILQNYTFQNCENLTSLPLLDLSGFTSGTTILQGCTALKDTFLDFTPATGATKLDLGGTSSARIDGLKGLLVSNEAPFTGTSPQLNASYMGLDRAALVNLFNSMPYNVGYTVVGSPTITDGVASGFSTTKHIAVSIAISKGDAYEVVTKISSTESLPSSWQFLGGYITLYASTGNMRITYYNGDTSTWVDTNVGGIFGNNTYYVKTIYTGSKVEVYKSDDNSAWTQLYSADVIVLGNSDTSIITFGGGTSRYWPGSIDLNSTYINLNGVPWFRGTAAVTKTCSIVGCTGTADLTADDKAIATVKGWELTVA